MSKVENRSIVNYFWTSVRNQPERNAIFIDNRHFTYTEVAGLTAAIASVLKPFPKGRFLLIAHSDIQTYAAMLAVLSHGSTYIPVHSGTPEQRIEQIVEISKAQCVLT